MSEPGSRRGRAHDAEGAREAILNAAEEVFASHGYEGAAMRALGICGRSENAVPLKWHSR